MRVHRLAAGQPLSSLTLCLGTLLLCVCFNFKNVFHMEIEEALKQMGSLAFAEMHATFIFTNVNPLLHLLLNRILSNH